MLWLFWTLNTWYRFNFIAGRAQIIWAPAVIMSPVKMGNGDVTAEQVYGETIINNNDTGNGKNTKNGNGNEE